MIDYLKGNGDVALDTFKVVFKSLGIMVLLKTVLFPLLKGPYLKGNGDVALDTFKVVFKSLSIMGLTSRM